MVIIGAGVRANGAETRCKRGKVTGAWSSVSTPALVCTATGMISATHEAVMDVGAADRVHIPVSADFQVVRCQRAERDAVFAFQRGGVRDSSSACSAEPVALLLASERWQRSIRTAPSDGDQV